MIKIRQIKLADLDMIAKIRKTCSLNPWPKALYKKFFEKYPTNFLVAESCEEVIGCVLGYKKTKDTGFIRTLAVAPDFRRKGAGTKLTKYIIKELKKSGARKILLHVRMKNKIARLFYKKLGFKTAETIKKYYRNGDDAYLMELDG